MTICDQYTRDNLVLCHGRLLHVLSDSMRLLAHREAMGHISAIRENTTGIEPPTPKPASARMTSSWVKFAAVADTAPKSAFRKRARRSERRRPGQKKIQWSQQSPSLGVYRQSIVHTTVSNGTETEQEQAFNINESNCEMICCSGKNYAVQAVASCRCCLVTRIRVAIWQAKLRVGCEGGWGTTHCTCHANGE